MLSNLEELHKEGFKFSWRERNEKGHQSAKTAQNGERPDPAAGDSDGNSEAGFWVNVEEERQQFLVIITRVYCIGGGLS